MKFDAVALVQMTRPGNVLITGLTVAMGGVLSAGDGLIDKSALLLAALSASLIAGGANAINDFYDLPIDLVNRPNRAIPSGRVGRSTAYIFGILITLIGLVAAWLASDLHLFVAIAVSILLWSYNSSLKRSLLFGNIAISTCGGLAFIFGGLATDHPSMAMIPAGFAFLIHFAREVIKDVEDVPGDKVLNARTLPIVAGERFALILSALTLALLILATWLPWHFGVYGIWYLVIVALFVDLPLAGFVVAIFLGADLPTVSKIGRALKLIMLFGLVALYVG